MIGKVAWAPRFGEVLASKVVGQWQEYVTPAGVEYRLDQNLESRDNQRLSLARAIAWYILRTTPEWLKDLVHHRYQDLDESDIQQVTDHAHARLMVDAAHNRDREELALARLLSFLRDHDTVVLDGAQRFLLPEIRHEYIEAVDQAMDDWLIEREYQEFVRLLRHFVSLNQPKMGTVHVFWRSLEFILEDDHGNQVGEDVVRDLSGGLSEDDSSTHDLLVSALITMGPRQVVFHRKAPADEILRTMHAVFTDHVTQCSGCRRCRQLTRAGNPL